MPDQDHIIKKQTIEIKLRKRNNAFNIRESIREIFYSRILKILDDLFSEICSKNEYLIIDKLELDLGILNSKNLEEDFENKLKERLYESFIEHIRSGQISFSNEAVTIDGRIIMPDEQVIKSRTDTGEKLYEKEYFLEIVKFFIMRGILPWWGDIDGIDTEEIFLDFIEKSPDEAADFISSLDEKSILRIIRQFSDEVHSGLLKMIYEEEYSGIFSFLDDLKTLFSTIEYDHPENEKSEEIILFILLKKAKNIVKVKSIPEQVFREFLRKSVSEQGISLPEMTAHFSAAVKSLKKKKVIFKSDLPDVIVKLENELKAIEKDNEIEKRAGKHHTDEQTYSKKENQIYKNLRDNDIEPDSSDTEADRNLIDNKRTEISEDSGEDLKFETDEDFEEVFISNAGLVLLNPFISRFFAKLNLIDDGKFKKTENKIKAALILQFLVTGAKEIPEHALPLNKLLCGLDISYPVPKEIDITDEIIAESEKLLKSVISHWKALKSTSVKGFRESFLMRKGKLEIRDRDFLLNVESHSFDIIMDTLPWGINIIKFDWMKKPLYVEWTL